MDPTESERSGPSAEELETLRRENRELKARLDRIDAQRNAKREVRNKGLRIGWGVLVPILDRQRVVRSFGELSNQLIRLADPNDQPEAREVAESAKEFLSNCVRFAVRRRLFFAVFALIAAAVPAIQLWLVMQQNVIIQKQNEFFQIEVYDTVARLMSEDSSGEKRKIAGLLLANADSEFLDGVVREIFDPSVTHSVQQDRAESENLKAVGYRGPLLRALARGLVLQRAEREDEEIYRQTRPSLERVYQDAAERIPRVLRWSRNSLSSGGAPEVHYYLQQIGDVLRVHSRLARSVDASDEFYAAIAPLFSGLARVRAGTGSPLDETLYYSLEPFLIDLAVQTEFGAPERQLSEKELKVFKVDGLNRLKTGLQKHKVNVAQLGAFVGASTP